MAKFTLLTDSDHWLFDGCADQTATLEKAIVYMLRQKKINNKTEMRRIKSGSVLFGSKKEVLVIKGDSTFEVAVSCYPVGSYLYVGVSRLENNGLFANLKRNASGDDIFKAEKQNAIYSAIVDCCERAFEVVNIASNYTERTLK